MKTLSMFSYFGGKAKLAPLICDLIDYDGTDIYLEPFGGACRVLLNKERHDLEIYNDSSAGLCAFVRLMSNQDTAHELIARLYETEYSQEQFDWALDIRNKVDDPLGVQISRELMRVYKKLKRTMEQCPDYQLNPEEIAEAKTVLDNWRAFTETYDIYHANLNAYKPQSQDKVKKGNLRDYTIAYAQDELYGISEIDLAVATYVVYSQSRDAIGKNWTSFKYKSQEAYYKQIDRLYDVANRLEGVQVTQVGALAYCLKNNYIESPHVFCYADPSYLDPKIKKKDLGNQVYKHPFSYEDHELFLDMVHNAKCKMIISNYDNELYNKYLRGWNKIEIPTKTSVGGKADNRRTEVLWYNYSL
ncbi:DNA adenine methylase [Agathobaculum sp. Marseille-P7918]|uniref:DNA adenine methylase n=1 Tax=Agathobaculum sp. Marseille-P7918 TaxID=2479843 RepID=UPI0035621F15